MSESSRSARVSPMPIRMPVVNGHRQFSGQPDRFQPTLRQLVGRAEMHAARFAQAGAGGFQHDALAGGDLTQ